MSSFKSHIKRKKSCGNDYYTLLKENKIISDQICDFKSQMITKVSNDHSNILSFTSENTFKCSYCQSTFSNNSNVNRHLKRFCKIKKNQDTEKEIIYNTLLKELDEQKIQVKKLKDLLKDTTIQNTNINTSNTVNTINKNTVNTVTNNTINNITINSFGKEDISYITDKEYREIFYSSSKSVPKLISKIHFNRKYPENSNIYISNLKDSYIMVYDGKTWNMSMKTDTIDQIFDSKIIHLDGIFENQLTKLDSTVKKRFRRFQDNLEHSKIENDIKQELKLLLYNSRILALKNKKQTDKILV
jgi:hypothetical protein